MCQAIFVLKIHKKITKSAGKRVIVRVEHFRGGIVMKKLSFLMILSLVLGLTACGGADKNTDKKEDTKTEVKEEAVTDVEGPEEVPEFSQPEGDHQADQEYLQGCDEK